jgi:hypothetical protein
MWGYQPLNLSHIGLIKVLACWAADAGQWEENTRSTETTACILRANLGERLPTYEAGSPNPS